MQEIGLFFTDGFQSIERTMSHPVIFGLLLVFCGIASYTDVKGLRIPNKLNGVLALFNLVVFVVVPIINGDGSFALQSAFGGVVGFLALLIPAVATGFKMAGDIKFIGAFGLAIGGLGIIPFLLLSCLLNLVVNLSLVFFKLQKPGHILPFAPFFFASYLLSILLF